MGEADKKKTEIGSQRPKEHPPEPPAERRTGRDRRKGTDRRSGFDRRRNLNQKAVVRNNVIRE